MSKHKQKDKEGFKTDRVHDIETKEFASVEKFLLIRKIDCYFSEEGIYGFFPSYANPIYDDTIYNKDTGNFYREFKKDYVENLKKREIIKGIKLNHQDINLERGEYIKKITVSYDEDIHRITALKFSTNKHNFSIGRPGDLNNKITTAICRKDNFIPGFTTHYLKDEDVCFLSYIQVFYEHENKFDKYCKAREPSRIKSFFVKKYNSTVNLIRTLSKVLLILFVLFFPFIFFYYKSQNLYGGEIVLPDYIHGLTNPVKIHTDSNGFSHIKADGKEDSYFALGFVHAKERLWQMDFIRRIGRGKLSEIFGTRTLQLDKLMRSIGMNHMSQNYALFIRQNSHHIAFFDSYINGINYFANNFILPIEYQIFRAEWKNWELADSIAVANIQVLTLTQDWNMEVWYKIMEESLGKEFADLVASFRDENYPFANETIVNDEELIMMNMHRGKKQSEEIIREEREAEERASMQRKRKAEEDETRGLIRKEKEDRELRDKAVKMVLEELEKKELERRQAEIEIKEKSEVQSETVKAEAVVVEQEHDISTLELLEEKDSDENISNDSTMGLNSLHNQGASNSWVLSGNLTSSGSPILSNDPHLANSMPSLYFIAKIYLPDDTLSGATIPGLPFFLTGSNKQISWGFTTENSDAADVCEEKIEDEFYIYDNKRFAIRVNKEKINIRGSQPEQIEVKWTRNGPLLPKTFPKELLVVNFPFNSDLPLSFRFAFYNFEFTNTDFYFALNHAKTSNDFKKEIDKHPAPNLNLAYATKDGEIGWLPLGTFPQKSFKNRFCRGYSSEDDMHKFINRNELPKLINPPKGFLITANNKFASFNYTYQMTGFHNHVRAFRIRQMIEDKIKNFTKFTIEDNIDMLKDVRDSLAEYMLPQILKIVERNTQASKLKGLKYYNELKNWDFNLIKDSNVPTIYSVLELFIGKQLLTNKISDQKARGIMSLLHYWNFISGIIDKIYQGERVDLKQCAHLSGNINCEKYIVYIFNNLDKFITEVDLKDKHGNVLKWGEVKFNHYPHPPFDLIPGLNKLFSRKVYTGGNRNTVKIARGPFNHDKGQFISTHSPRLKFVCDMSHPTSPYVILDSGNSGNVFSRFYDNLITKHENSELVQFDDVDMENLTAPSMDTMILRKKANK